MTYSNVTAYLVACRAWHQERLRAAMRGELFTRPVPMLERQP